MIKILILLYHLDNTVLKAKLMYVFFSDFDSNSSQQRMIIRNLNDELNSMKEKLSQAEEEASNKSEQVNIDILFYI